MPSSINSSELSLTSMSWQNVFLQCIQPMISLVLLLRFSSIVDEAGFAITLLLVLLTFLIGLVTAWSACTVITRNNNTNGVFRVLTSYSNHRFAIAFSSIYLLCLLFASSIFVSASAEAFLHIFSTFNIRIFDGATHDLRIVSSVISLVVLVVSVIRFRYSRHARFLIFMFSLIAIALHLSGVIFRYGEYQLRRIPEVNVMIPAPPVVEVTTIFSQLFPASICALSVLSFGSKLQPSAPRGTLLAIGIGAAIYSAAALFDYIEFFARPANHTMNSAQTEFQSYIYTTIPIAIVVTIACILSAVTMLKYASSLLQSMGRSNLCSKLLWVCRGYGNRDVPLRCLLILSFLQTLICLIGSYDLLCIPTTVFFLIAYCIFNFYVFLVKLDNSEIPSPPAMVSLLISAVCLLCAIYTNRHLSLVEFAIFALIYCYQMYLERDRKTEGEEKSKYSPVLEQMHQLQMEPDNCRQYHPQILLLTGNPAVRPALVDFAHSITRGKSLLICGYIIPQKTCSRSYLLQLKIDKQINDWLKSREVNAFGSAICCVNMADGANTLLQIAGLGRLRPNILMLGYKTNWNQGGKGNLEAICEYFGMLSNAFEKQVGLIVFRNETHGFDLSSSIRKNGEPINGDEELAEYVESQQPKTSVGQQQQPEKKGGQKGKLLSSMQTTFRKMSLAATRDVESGMRSEKNRFQVIDKHSVSEPDQKMIIGQMFRFRKRIPNSRIDVFWLREAGGLTMLVPYLLSQADSFLEGAHIRVFTKTDGKDNKRINEEQKNMAAVLRKFKIDSTDLHILPAFSTPPTQQTTDKFNQLIEPFMVPKGVDKLPGMFDEDQLFNLREKTRNYLRASELIKEHSTDADLIICTLPSARPDIPASLYLAWIDILSRQTPPVCLVRGNQVSIAALQLRFP